jgi:hypothetical protein
LLAHGLPDPQGEQPLVVGQAVEEQDPVGEQLRVPHLIDRLGACVRGEPGQPPVRLHPGVQEVLVDRGELAGELLVEQVDDLRVAAHEILVRSRVGGPL